MVTVNLLTSKQVMSYTKGGRGKQAPYSTTHVRVPEDCKPFVDTLVRAYKQLIDEPQLAWQLLEDVRETVSQSFGNITQMRETTKPVNSYSETHLSKQEAIELTEKLLRAKKSKKETLEKLLTSIYDEDVKLTNL